jgi:ribosomal protein L17
VHGISLKEGGNRMAYQMTVTLTDQEYQVLAAEAARRGEPPETLLRDLIRHLQADASEKRPMSGRELAEKLYREGKLASLATKRPLSQEEQEERERLARLFASDKPASEMVIEDRGPY